MQDYNTNCKFELMQDIIIAMFSIAFYNKSLLLPVNGCFLVPLIIRPFLYSNYLAQSGGGLRREIVLYVVTSRFRFLILPILQQKNWESVAEYWFFDSLFLGLVQRCQVKFRNCNLFYVGNKRQWWQYRNLFPPVRRSLIRISGDSTLSPLSEQQR